MSLIHFDAMRLPDHCQELRKEVRAFLESEIAAGTFDPDRPEVGAKNADEFSRRVGAKG